MFNSSTLLIARFKIMSLLTHTLKCILSLWMSVITMTFKIGRQQIVKISFLYFKQSGFVSMTLCPNYNFCCCCCRRWWLNFIAMREYTIIKSINLFHGKCKRIKYHRMRLFILVQFRIIVCSVKQFNRCFYSFFPLSKMTIMFALVNASKRHQCLLFSRY